MNKKQKKNLRRILIALALVIAAKNFVEKSGKNCTALLNREESLP